MRKDDLLRLDALLVEPFKRLEHMSGSSYEQKELRLLESLPPKVGRYYLVFRLHALWSNGGWQAAALDKDSRASEELLERSIEAFIFFGAQEETKLLKQIVPIAVRAAHEIDALLEREAPDDLFELVWARLDALDSHYDGVFSKIYPAIVADIKAHPDDWKIQAT